VLAGNTPVLVHNTGPCDVSKYEDITVGGSIQNRLTNVTHTEFGDNLVANGFSRIVSKDGKVLIYTKDGVKYTLREKADSYNGWTAEYFPAGSTGATLKIRLGG
jgi:hypothetical protein